MATPGTNLSSVFSNISVCAVCLWATARTFQEHRGAAAGFFLQSLASACFLAPTLLHSDGDSFLSSGTWSATTIGLPLLAFGFFWINGDHFTANMILSVALLLSTSFDYMTQEGRTFAAHASYVVSSLGILMVSIFTGNGYGVFGSLGLGTAGLLFSLKAEKILFLPLEVAMNAIRAASFLSFSVALRNHQSDTE
ncbi:hypothetical protein XENTR_v10019645 [Xenopus tropicalis]|uniref:Cysteine/histidine-rich 1 n=1 Tax=Xenopus tropicalis TaxID=8364 RepID=A0A6I8SFU5_XENTR|nr:uncharacterized protein cyhr1 [Xenopus tropicalis]KAE8594445.1 hypothetical protein XENTR_v10019645 [Xenopus tropicalis]KAE8594446.1 hypothetical protein XENTR_v10019645 [Xenopus tropicalis]KAE8594447.1 hypothetical protein XENTR_v10019645 [Xenopus tropicalis]KAE8594448.1 hypothetical protein XENTR_v10019645 [Xenopus tropicalis]KAE8594449.1 hypothetical protein XENTR_v10019645 [Xenopus tropicalis]